MTADRAEIFGGVDTHKQVHVAAALDAAGRLLATAEFDAAPHGYGELASWLQSWGAVRRVGVEGTGSYGAGLTRHLAAAGVEVVEVNRPNRQTRRQRGKTDTVDAEAAARAALNGEATAVPKSADGCVEAIRTLSVARRSAVKARTVAANQINAVAVTAPEQVKDLLRKLNTPQMIKICARWRISVGGAPAAGATKRAMRALARRHQALTAEIDELDAELLALCEQANPALLGACGVGAKTAAALCGTSPIEASSGPRTRHRLNRGGNRQANKALWRIAMVRLRVHQQSIDYAARRRAQGSTRRETIRCLKRHIAREIYRLLTHPPQVPHGTDLRRHRNQHSLTLDAAAQALHTHTTRISALERDLYHTATSPNATNNTSPKSRLDKHRSIIDDTIIARSNEILAWHHTNHPSNARIKAHQQPPPSPTTNRPRVHQPHQLPSPRTPDNMTRQPVPATPNPTFTRKAEFLRHSLGDAGSNQ